MSDWLNKDLTDASLAVGIINGIRKMFNRRSGSATRSSDSRASQALQAAADSAEAARQLGLELQRQQLELKKAREEDALRHEETLEKLQEAYKKSLEAARRETKIAQEAIAKEGAGASAAPTAPPTPRASAAPTAPPTPERGEPAGHRAVDRDQAVDRDLDRDALMKQSPRVLKQLAKNAGLSLVGINDKADLVEAVLQGRPNVPMAQVLAAQQQAVGTAASPSPGPAARARGTAGTGPAAAAGPAETASQELSERLVLLMSQARMLDMDLAEAERQHAVYTEKYNREFTHEMLAHPSEIDGEEIDEDDTLSSASAKELVKVVKKLLHTLALRMHPDKNPGQDSSAFQRLTKAEKELDLPAMLAMADRERVPVPDVPPAALEECERRIAEKRKKLTEMKTSNAWSWGSAGHAPPAELRERIVRSLGIKYVGQLKKGKLHGNGNAEWPSGSWYKGQWRDGEFHGKGQHFVAGEEGYLYKGNFKDHMQDGQGTLKYNSGGGFVGEFEKNQRKKGILTLDNGDLIEGAFVDGQLTGKGKLISSSSERPSYRGDFVKGLLHGRGIWEFEGKKYEGEFREGELHGYGIMQSPYKPSDGSYRYIKEYRGNYRDGKRFGVGQYEFWDGEVTMADAASFE